MFRVSHIHTMTVKLNIPPLQGLCNKLVATVDPTLNLYTRYPLLLGSQKQFWLKKLAMGFNMSVWAMKP
jgi:hypothetical protein